MSVWTTPITWATGAVTAAQFNTEIRDHLAFLKGALDLLTNSTTADTGDGTSLKINRSSSTLAAYQAQVTGDANSRWLVTAEGTMEWGLGPSARDVNLYRGGNDQLKTDDDFAVGTLIRLAASGAVVFTERTDPAAPAANTGILYVRDNGSGKTQLVVRFPTGAIQTIATEP